MMNRRVKAGKVSHLPAWAWGPARTGGLLIWWPTQSESAAIRRRPSAKRSSLGFRRATAGLRRAPRPVLWFPSWEPAGSMRLTSQGSLLQEPKRRFEGLLRLQAPIRRPLS